MRWSSSRTRTDLGIEVLRIGNRMVVVREGSAAMWAGWWW